MTNHFESLARELEASPNHRVLRRLEPRDVFCHSPCARPGVGIILDCETTGLDPSTAEVIELAMVKFHYSEDGSVLRVVDEFDELQEPSSPIPAEITRLTGIDDDMVRGHSIDPFRVEGFLLDADIVIAHCARFDRPFVERVWPSFRTIDWACSLDQVPWRDHGFDGAKLVYLLMHRGFFFEAHRAGQDCRALLELLASPLPLDPEAKPALATLLANARQNTTRLYAADAPFDMKNVLKARRYRWSNGSNGARKSWWLDLPAGEFEAEVEFLRAAVFGGRAVDFPTESITAKERYSDALSR